LFIAPRFANLAKPQRPSRAARTITDDNASPRLTVAVEAFQLRPAGGGISVGLSAAVPQLDELAASAAEYSVAAVTDSMRRNCRVSENAAGRVASSGLNQRAKFGCRRFGFTQHRGLDK